MFTKIIKVEILSKKISNFVRYYVQNLLYLKP